MNCLMESQIDLIIENHEDDKNLRSGEGCILELADTTLFMVYGKFKGASNSSSADLFSRISKDGGETWSEAKLFFSKPENALNIMSVSLLRLNDGKIACLFLLKESENNCYPVIMYNNDNTESWSSPVSIVNRKGYYVVNNDRLVQTKSGRILVPFAYNSSTGSYQDPACGCVFSDNGKDWRIGEEIKIKKENYLKPKKIMDNSDAFENITVNCQEPGIVELENGETMMWARTCGGYMYTATSKDGAETWSDFTANPQYAMPCGPQSIKKIPGSKRLAMLFNDRYDEEFGTAKFNWRTPLSIAISDDNGNLWKKLKDLENKDKNYCYFSICFTEDSMLTSYYLSGKPTITPEGEEIRPNLASLKIKKVSLTNLKQ